MIKCKEYFVNLGVYSDEELENVLQFPRPRYTVDCVVYDCCSNTILLQKRNLTEPPEYFGKLALPGGHINKGEGYKNAAVRELKEEMGISLSNPELINVYDELTFNGKEVDSRGWRVTIGVVFNIVRKLKINIDGDEVSGYSWISVDEILSNPDLLAFNHWEIVHDAANFGLLT